MTYIHYIGSFAYRWWLFSVFLFFVVLLYPTAYVNTNSYVYSVRWMSCMLIRKKETAVMAGNVYMRWWIGLKTPQQIMAHVLPFVEGLLKCWRLCSSSSAATYAALVCYPRGFSRSFVFKGEKLLSDDVSLSSVQLSFTCWHGLRSVVDSSAWYVAVCYVLAFFVGVGGVNVNGGNGIVCSSTNIKT